MPKAVEFPIVKYITLRLNMPEFFIVVSSVIFKCTVFSSTFALPTHSPDALI